MRTFYVRQRNKTTLISGISLNRLFNELIQSEGKLIHPTQPLELIPGHKVTITRTDGSFVHYCMPEDLAEKEKQVLPALGGLAIMATLWMVVIGVNMNDGHVGGWVMKWLVGY